MSACQKELERPITKLGIVAGGGALPELLLKACLQKDIEPFVIGFDGQTAPDLVQGHNHMWTRLGAAGQILKTLKAHDIHDLVLIGSMRRPSVSELMPDLRTAQFFARVGLKALGDDGFLQVLRQELEDEGFTVHGAHYFIDDLLSQHGVLGHYKPKKADWIDIKKGWDVSQKLGELDIGQSVIVQEGLVLGVEGAEGTDELIRRCKHLKRKGRKGVLVKTCKPQQDQNLDLPTIGPETIEEAARSDLSGIAVHAQASLMIDVSKIAEMADQHKIFVVGIDPLQDFSKP